MTRSSFLLDDDMAAYLSARTAPPSELEQALIEETAQLPEAGMQIAWEQAAFLRFLVAASRAKKILELGSFTGYSALAMASALPEGGTLTALVHIEEWTASARRYWEQAGVADKIDLHIGNAAEMLRAMPQEPTFDFVFIDADKPGYPEYLELTVPLLESGGVLVADNTLRRGRVIDSSDTTEGIEGVRRFNDAIAADERLESQLLPLWDGVTVAIKR